MSQLDGKILVFYSGDTQPCLEAWRELTYVSAFHLSMANEAQASQAHRAELDFDINGLKEKIETLDQGGIHSFGFESGPMYTITQYPCRFFETFKSFLGSHKKQTKH